MILEPFDIVSGGTRFTFVDRETIDSDAERAVIFQIMAAQLALMQEDAKCEALGIEESGIVGNLGFGVYGRGVLVGVFLVASLDYQSGPWADLTDWEVTALGSPAIFHARPMPGFPPGVLSLGTSLDLSVDAAHHLLSEDMTSIDGTDVRFSRLSWAIYKDRTDANSRAAKRIHDQAAADPRLSMIEADDPDEAERTRVDIELA